jgi:tetratricopeptide (TPR) repeat protein
VITATKHGNIRTFIATSNSKYALAGMSAPQQRNPLMSTRIKKSNKSKTTPSGHQLTDLLAVRDVLTLLDQFKYDEARVACEKIIKRVPNLVFANNAMGLIALKQEDFKSAEHYLRRAVDADPSNYEYITNLGHAVTGLERIDDAIALFNQALLLNDDHKPARIGLATALQEKDDPEAMVAFFQEAAKRVPDIPGPLSHLGKALIDAGRPNDAVTILLKSLEIQINFAPAHVHLGMAFRAMNMLDEALECHKTAILLDPNDIFTNIQIAETHLIRKEFDLATPYYERLIEIAPNDPNSYTKLASHLSGRYDRYDEAIKLFDKALALNPNYALVLNNIGAIMHDHGALDGAIRHLNRALELKPNYLTARHNLALAQLQLGNFKEGWLNHESRLEVKERKQVYTLIHSLFKHIPKWDGKTSLKDKSILLMHEQGFGDSIQFARYVHLLLDQGATVFLYAKDSLAQLFSTLSERVTIIREKDPLPKCDYSYVLMSLPLALGTDSPEKIPSYPAYLFANDNDKARWEQIIQSATPPNTRLRVGIIWAGNPEHGNDRRRSMPLEAMSPLFNIEGVQIYSLQKGDDALKSLQTTPQGHKVIDLGNQFNSFADTAAAIEAMDLVLSVDTSVTHLAGALGKPTWTLLAYVADWRWLLDREDTPWYPNMRLFRQKEPGNWPELIERVQQGILSLRNAQQ